MTPRLWRMVDTIARCIRRGSLNDYGRLCSPGMNSHQQYIVELVEEGRQVAAAVSKTIVSKRQPAAQANAARKQRSRKITAPCPAMICWCGSALRAHDLGRKSLAVLDGLMRVVNCRAISEGDRAARGRPIGRRDRHHTFGTIFDSKTHDGRQAADVNRRA